MKARARTESEHALPPVQDQICRLKHGLPVAQGFKFMYTCLA